MPDLILRHGARHHARHRHRARRALGIMRQLFERYHDRFHSFRLQSMTFTEHFSPMSGTICKKGAAGDPAAPEPVGFFVLFHFAGIVNAIEGVQELFAVQTADDLLRALGEQR